MIHIPHVRSFPSHIRRQNQSKNEQVTLKSPKKISIYLKINHFTKKIFFVRINFFLPQQASFLDNNGPQPSK